MADTTPPVDPVTPPAPSPDVTPPAAPVANAPDPAEVEALRKSLEQQQLRTRQLENEKAAADKAAEDAKAKELEKQNEFKTLYETSEAKRKELENEKELNTKKAEVKTESDKVLADYSPEVRKLAETTGLSLTDTDAATVEAFKAKLEEVKGMVGPAKVTPNNPNTPTPEGPSVADADGVIKTPLSRDSEKLDSIFASMPGISGMMSPPPTQ